MRSHLKLEHRTQKVIPFSHFLARLAKYAGFAMLLIFASVLIGAVGYHHLGELNWIDSFHMACMILTGMGPVEVMRSDGAKLFSSFYALYSGVAFLTTTAVFFTPLIHRLLHILHVEETEA